MAAVARRGGREQERSSGSGPRIWSVNNNSSRSFILNLAQVREALAVPPSIGAVAPWPRAQDFNAQNIKLRFAATSSNSDERRRHRLGRPKNALSTISRVSPLYNVRPKPHIQTQTEAQLRCVLGPRLRARPPGKAMGKPAPTLSSFALTQSSCTAHHNKTTHSQPITRANSVSPQCIDRTSPSFSCRP